MLRAQTQESIAAALQKQLAKMERDRSHSQQLLEVRLKLGLVMACGMSGILSRPPTPALIGHDLRIILQIAQVPATLASLYYPAAGCLQMCATWKRVCSASHASLPSVFPLVMHMMHRFNHSIAWPKVVMRAQLPSDTTGINSSHVIHKLSFGGSEFPGQVNPLDGARPATCTLTARKAQHGEGWQQRCS